jgi:peptide/nickel transport system substrate-binding protein
MRRIDDLKQFQLVIIIGIMLMLQACSTGESSQVDNESEKDNKVLIVARKSDVTNLDPHFIVDVSTANVLYEKVYETLVIPNDNMEPQPHLATEWEQVDETTWAFTLRDDVEFHDGTKFNADAVKKTFDRLLNPETASPQASKLGMIKEVEVVDDQHVIFHLLTPYAPLLSILASNEGSILNPKILEKDPESLKKYANGTGPFVFEEWKSGQVVKLSKNKKYWGKEPK